MNSQQSFLIDLVDIAQKNNHRYGVVLGGDARWQDMLLSSHLADTLQSTQLNEPTFFQLGGTKGTNCESVSFKQGKRFLGRECQRLICDFRDGFDANSFSSALGSLVGGGLLIILVAENEDASLAQYWLQGCLSQLYLIDSERSLPTLPSVIVDDGLDDQPLSIPRPFRQQTEAIDMIKNVVFGHRKRPLVLTADRGRGKSSALGIAASQLMSERPLKIMVTAPNSQAVAPIFEHAFKGLPSSTFITKHHLQTSSSSLEFIAPDELLNRINECDVLFVDEAAAIPLPMLKRYVQRHHRIVFSTTVHGYEGSGRGFGLKFQAWLNEVRPGWKPFYLEQPIRWNVGDPLEKWLFDSFLLNAELEPIDVERSKCCIEEQSLEKMSWLHLDKAKLVEAMLVEAALNSQSVADVDTLNESSQGSNNPLRACFALLVNAHYQTTPNDLIQLLADDSIHLFGLFSGADCIGCLLVVEEGDLSSNLIDEIQRGKRRPKGHLVPTTLANHLGATVAAKQKCLRVMRIAVHPELQGHGLGSFMLNKLEASTLVFDYLATSFGATQQLVSFWNQVGYEALHIGHQRDQASGCHSLLMVKPFGAATEVWYEKSHQRFIQNLSYLISDSLSSMEVDLVVTLLPSLSTDSISSDEIHLLDCYISGGGSFDSIAVIASKLIIEMSLSHKDEISDLLILKVIQKRSWGQCCEMLGLSGRKQAERNVRDHLQLLLNLHCK
ncbi:tRNA(Met) cytidine acetyltransferase [Vibrio genomosp. F6]|uniref:tRNA(Met) cytidine acetyltransferase TmcA n=1 Tax=Vibrio genomosp. F6 TaxID=723172 RepID=UPI0010BD03B1|nr:GNAT family N-acetyltransferase [Vibrio genomosp. F6]TKF21554.1 tRNA(Met) cytidine acetyltransferase [Vibrio genomosp. F6]